MNKIISLLVLAVLASLQIFAQEERDLTKPIPEKDVRYGLVSISGHIGFLYNEGDTFDDEVPYLKIGFYYNFSQTVSIMIGGGITKFKGPDSFILEADGYIIDPSFLALLGDYYFNISDIEETWYSAQLTFNLKSSGVKPYIFGGAKVISIDYQQEMVIKEKGSAAYSFLFLRYVDDRLGIYAGGGIKIPLTDYLEIQLEGEWNEILNTKVYGQQIVGLIGFTFTI